MRRIALILFAMATVLSCKKDNEIITPSGAVTKIEKAFTDFSAVEVSGGLNVILTFNSTEKVVIEASENIQPYIVAMKVGNKLLFKKVDNIDFEKNTVINIYISAKKITALTASGGSAINSTNAYDVDNLTLNFSGGSDFNADLNCNSLTSTLSGGSTINLTGASDVLTLNASDGSDFSGFSFAVKRFTCDVSNGGKVNLTVNEKLDIVASGGSIINYKGAGLVNSKNLTGGSELNKK